MGALTLPPGPTRQLCLLTVGSQRKRNKEEDDGKGRKEKKERGKETGKKEEEGRRL